MVWQQGESEPLSTNGTAEKLPEKSKLLKQIRNLTGHTQPINRLAWSPDQRFLASTSYDYTVRVWDMTTRNAPRVLSGPTDWVTSVTWSNDGQMLAAGSGDSKIWIWDAKTGQIQETFKANTRTVFSVAWSPDGQLLASGAGDSSVMLWDASSYRFINLLQGHSGPVYCVAWSPNGRSLASCSEDGTVRIWDAQNGRLKRILEGHTAPVYDLAWSPDGKILASASGDMTIRLWGRQVGVLEGHTGVVNSLSFSFDGDFLASKSMDGTIRLWRCDWWETVEIVPEPVSPYWTSGMGFHPQRSVLATLGGENLSIRIWNFDAQDMSGMETASQTIRYTSAKVVLVGDSGVGKTCLAAGLMRQSVEDAISTHGRHVQRFNWQENILGNGAREIQETYLWDMAGQPSYRLIHQLHLNQVAVALVVFDMKSELDPFAGVRFWARALRHAQKLKSADWPLKMFLVAGRIDRGGVGVGRQRIIDEIQKSRFDRYFETSSVQGWGIKELEAAINKEINWKALPKVSSTRLFQVIKNFLTHVRESGRLLHTVEQLYDTFVQNTPEASTDITDLRTQFETCIGLVESQGLIRRFSFGNLVLLQPEILDAYASVIIASAKDETDDAGSIAEEAVINCQFRMPKRERIANENDERLLLIATIEDLIRHEIAMRDEDPNGVSLLVFPSQSGRKPPGAPEPNSRTAIFTFEGPILNVYAVLAVRLWNSRLFASKEVYENATFFYATESKSNGNGCCVYLRPIEEGQAELAVYFGDDISNTTYHYVEEYVNAHLMRRALPGTLERKELVVCSDCGTVISEDAVKKARGRNKNYVVCPVCETRIPLKLEAPKTARQSFLRQAMVTRVDREADNQRERQMARSIIQGKHATGDFDIFFCHNGLDKPNVMTIGEELQNYGVLPWLDEWELPPDQPWQPLIEKQVLESKMMALFVGGNGINPQQEHELAMFMELKRPVILVFLSDAPRNPQIPRVLRGADWVNFRKADPDPIDQFVFYITGTHPKQNK